MAHADKVEDAAHQDATVLMVVLWLMCGASFLVTAAYTKDLEDRIVELEEGRE